MTTSPLFKRVHVDATGERLREAAVLIAPLGSMSGPDRWQAAQLMRQAADEIEALKAAASPEPPAEEVETVRKRVKELEEALAPFSLIGGPLNAVTEGVFPDDASARFLNLGELKAKHFRGAATALDRARAKGDG